MSGPSKTTMARFEFQGINEYAENLSNLYDESETMIKRAVYDGAAVVAKEVKSEISGLSATDRNPSEGEELTLLSYEKEGLLNGLGLSEMKNENGFINTKLGFSGYNRLRSKTYPKGHPNVMIARAINSGTSIRRKNPFMTRAIRQAKEKAEAAMAARFDEDTKEIIK